jgi:DNA-binding transcriptional regulator YiaG
MLLRYAGVISLKTSFKQCGDAFGAKDEKMEFAEKVRFVRERLRISQEELARALNVSYATINRWENSRTVPYKMAQGVFSAFCEKNGVTLSEKNHDLS